MKKGLLSLLALALTVVGCQNYDDQFAELTELIEGVQADVDGLSDLQTRLDGIDQTIGGLATAASLTTLSGQVTTLAGQVTDVAGDVSDIDSAIDALEGEIDSILQDIEDLGDVATQEDIDAINDRLDDVEEDLAELLAANAVINQNITINNVATLEYVESLISTATDDPNVIVNGSITIEVDEDDFNSAQFDRVNEVARKFATSLATVTITNTYSPSTEIDLANLAFIDSNLIVDGKTNIINGDTSDDKLRTVSGDITLTGYTGDVNLGLLTAAEDVSVPQGITELLLGNAELSSISTTGSGTGELRLTAATAVDTGDATINELQALAATDVDITAAVTVTINAPKAATIDVDGAGASYGTITVTGTDTTVVRFDALTAVGTLTTDGNVAEFHAGKLASAADIDSDAVVADLAKLASVTNDVLMTKILVFNTPLLDVAGVVSLTSATDITVKDVSSGYDFGAPAATDLTILKLASTNDFALTGSGYDFGKLTDLTVNGVAEDAPSISNQTNTVSSTSAVLVNVTTTGMLDELKLYAGTKLASVDTDGNIRHFELRGGGEDLASVSLDHGHIEGSDAATLIVANNSHLASLVPSELDELGDITVQDNAKLATLDLSSFATLPQLGAYTITISNTALTGNYVEATILVTTTAARDERIRSAALASLKPAITLAAAAANVTYTFTGDLVSNVTTSTRSNVNDDIVATSTNTSTLQALISYPSSVINAETNVTTEVTESDFVYIESL